MESPDIYQVSQIVWQFWCTFTFKRELPNSVQGTMWAAMCRRVAGWGGVEPRKLLWVCRRERGELLGRRHFHVLLGGLPNWMCRRDTAFSIKNQWEALGGGMSRV